MAKRTRKSAWIAWLIQILGMAALSTVATLLPLIFPAHVAIALQNAFAWGVLPIAGAAGAYWATRRGLNAYLAWIAPPVVSVAVHWLVIIGYPPQSSAPMFIIALAAIISAAAGDVRNKMEKDE